MPPTTRFISTGISFGLQLASAPTPHIVPAGTAPPAQRPGTPTHPQAAQGHLCVYEAVFGSRANVRLFNPTNGVGTQASRWAVAVAFEGTGGTNNTFSYGSWAVTSP